MNIYPIKLKSVLKDIIWGGTDLSDKYGLSEKGTRIAEAWTLTLRGDGENTIENGEAQGLTLREYAEKIGMESLCGKKYADKDFYDFPLLVKLIDAKDNLSVQVHPDDCYAHSHGIDSGKTEMWYIVDAKPGAQLVYGLRDGTDITSDEFLKATSDGNISSYLNYVDVKKGDIYYIPAGMVHAIGEGILIAEVQQNSNSTFRLYDYGRVGADGKPRELHLDKALEVIKTDFSHDHSVSSGLLPDTVGMPVRVVDSEYFGVTKLILEKDKYTFEGGKMTHVMCVDGKGTLEYNDENGNTVTIEIPAAHSVLVPEAFGGYTLVANDRAEFILANA